MMSLHALTFLMQIKDIEDGLPWRLPPADGIVDVDIFLLWNLTIAENVFLESFQHKLAMPKETDPGRHPRPALHIASLPGAAGLHDAVATQACRSSCGSIGSERSRLPVAAKMAFTTAGAMITVDTSPRPPGDSPLLIMCVSMGGTSLMRSSR
ncbi:hypothetical protein D9M70_402940 [compost metagenome]